MDEQERRFRQRIDEPVRQWKLSPMDTESFPKWWDYSAAYTKMLQMTDTDVAPWWKIDSNDKKRAQINAITHLIHSVPNKQVKFDKPKLGEWKDRPTHVAAELPFRHVVPDVSAKITRKAATAVAAEAQTESTTNDQ